MPRIKVKVGDLKLLAETTSENPGTVEGILENLPVQGEAQRWGEEIYFMVRFELPKEHTRQECKPGEIAYWPDGPAIAIFFGKTPVSQGNKPRAYSPCNFFAKLVQPWDKGKLNAVKDGSKIVLSKAK